MSEFEKSKMKRRPYGRDSFVKVFLLMNDRRIKLGFSITEVLVVVAIIAVLVGIGVPAAKQMQKSFESTAGVKNVIGAALGNARAIALKEGKYAGVRFQQDAAGRQYMVLVIHDPASPPTVAELAADPYVTGTGLANGFRAVKGRKPLPLPENVGVMDLQINAGSTDEESQLRDTTTFSIVFSSAGKLVTHDVWVRNRHGKNGGDDGSTDNVFNTQNNVEQNGVGLFVQDGYDTLGLVEEASRKFFVIYEKNDFAKVDWAQWNVYLNGLEKVYINPYSGEIIK